MKILHEILTIFIGAVWLINGLICKVLNIVPRHEQIVATILGDNYSRHLTVLIGLMEIVMAIWIFTKFKTRLNAIVQIIVIAIMNILEYILVSDLLLWGKLNSFFALLFVALIYYNEFVLNNKLKLHIQ